ncbi:MAG: LacI family transcriptional regulator [Treponema sp.]|jgi:LacI family transcriptional regulator|nr:LacI family transcriptional regulator [Treponema sp.]
MITIHDVAKKAGVSTATVSHVCNNTRYVSDDLRQKVFDAMKELNYKPNLMARRLKGGSLKTIGLIVPDCTNFFFAEISRAIDRCCFSLGYNIILCNTDNDMRQQSLYTDMLISKQVDGAIIISSDYSVNDINKFKQYSIPLVIADRESTDESVDSILVDNEKGAYQAVSYLLGLNLDTIACVTGPERVISSNQRLEGYKKALRDAGKTVDEKYIFTGDFHFEGGIAAFEYFEKLPKIPDGVFALNDMMALGFIHRAISGGIKIPEQISVMGFDNTQLSKIMLPQLSTVAQPIEELAEISIRKLLEQIDHIETPVKKVILDPYLVIRDSCKKK